MPLPVPSHFLQVDGCVMFYRRSKFMLVESYALEFNDSARDAAAAQGDGSTHT